MRHREHAVRHTLIEQVIGDLQYFYPAAFNRGNGFCFVFDVIKGSKIANISISKIIRLRLGDALLFVVYHNERHVQQAKNLLKHPKFPAS
jgi:hypothetical protein